MRITFWDYRRLMREAAQPIKSKLNYHALMGTALLVLMAGAAVVVVRLAMIECGW